MSIFFYNVRRNFLQARWKSFHKASTKATTETCMRIMAMDRRILVLSFRRIASRPQRHGHRRVTVCCFRVGSPRPCTNWGATGMALWRCLRFRRPACARAVSRLVCGLGGVRRFLFGQNVRTYGAWSMMPLSIGPIAKAAVQRVCGRECARPYMGTRGRIPRMSSRSTMSGVLSQFEVNQRRDPNAIGVNRPRQVGGNSYRNRYLHEKHSFVIFCLKDCHIYVSESLFF